MTSLPSIEEFFGQLGCLVGATMGRDAEAVSEALTQLESMLQAERNAVLEAAAEVVQRREVENGTAAEGEEEPWFSIHTHTEAQLHNAVGDIRALKEDL